MDRRTFIASTAAGIVLGACGLPALGAKKVTAIPLLVMLDTGQSNDIGSGGDAALAPPVTVGYLLNTANKIVAFPASKGLQSAYMEEDYARTGIATLAVRTAVSGAPIMPVAGNVDWSSTGTCWPDAMAKLQAARNAIAASNGKYTLAGIELRLFGGETDGGLNITQAQYEAALEAFRVRAYTDIPDLAAFNLIRTGCRIDGQPGHWPVVRAAQDAFAAANVATVNYLARGAFAAGAQGQLQPNEPHIMQGWLNVLGRCAAIERDAIRHGNQTALPFAPPNAFVQPFPDDSFDPTGKSGRIVADIATQPSTKTLLIAICSAVAGAANEIAGGSVTFNGISVPRQHEYQVFGASSCTDTAFFLLDEAHYGALLGGLTGAVLNYSAPAALNLCDVTVLEFDSDVLADALYGAQRRTSDPPATVIPNIAKGVATLRHGVTTGAPALIVVAGASCQPGATPYPATSSNLAIAVNHGLSDGVNAAQSCIATAAEAVDVTDKPYAITWNPGPTTMAAIAVALRTKAAGE